MKGESSSCACKHNNIHYFTADSGGCRFTLLGCTALLRFSIHLSRSADERQEKHLLPEEVVTCGREASGTVTPHICS